MSSQMIGSPEKAQSFLDSVGGALDKPVQEELDVSSLKTPRG